MKEQETQRLANLRALEILDTPAEAMFDDITGLAADICEAPLAAIALVDDHRLWFKSSVGFELTQTPRDGSFGHHAISQSDIFEVPDVLSDPRFQTNPLVTGEPRIRFYAAMPLTDNHGTHPGTLCVLDVEPRSLNAHQSNALRILSKQASNLLELRRIALLQQREAQFARAMVEHTAAALIATDSNGLVTHCNPAASALLGYSPEEIVGRASPALWHVPSEIAERASDLSSRYDTKVEPGFQVFTIEADRGIEASHHWTFRRADETEFVGQLSVRQLRDSHDTQIGYLGVFTDISQTVAAQSALNESLAQIAEVAETAEFQRSLLAQVLGILETFISQPSTKKAFDQILQVLLDSTGSEYGFIGQVLYTEDNTPYLKTHALTNIAWNKETREFYRQYAPQGMEFTNLNTLFGHVMAHGEMVISNSPSTDPRRGGLPDGHPNLNAFLGIPIWAQDKLVGMFGIANREGGYDESVASDIQPLLATYGHLIEARRNRVRREEAEKSLTENRVKLARVFEASGLVSWSWDLASDRVTLGGAWRSIQQTADCNETIAMQDWIARIHAEDRDGVQESIQSFIRGETSLSVQDYRVQVQDGTWRWLRTEITLTDTDDTGAPTSISGTHKDVHDRHILEAQARQLAVHTTMIQEVHHRVKNNLQIVSSLLSFQQMRSHDPEVSRQFEVTRNRVAAIASLHETLYRSDSLQSVKLGALLLDLARDIRQAYGITSKQLLLCENDEDLEIPFDKAGPCALVVNEWVTNAIKHAFTNRPDDEIRIRYQGANQDEIEVVVEDNGKGIEPTGERRTGSLGLKLVGRLASQLSGSVQQLPTDIGTSWCLRFRVRK